MTVALRSRADGVLRRARRAPRSSERCRRRCLPSSRRRAATARRRPFAAFLRSPYCPSRGARGKLHLHLVHGVDEPGRGAGLAEREADVRQRAEARALAPEVKRHGDPEERLPLDLGERLRGKAGLLIDRLGMLWRRRRRHAPTEQIGGRDARAACVHACRVHARRPPPRLFDRRLLSPVSSWILQPVLLLC